jgi:hypothetical protein
MEYSSGCQTEDCVFKEANAGVGNDEVDEVG